ncbi:MAG: hypothetical protein ABIJ21_08720 [Nanoarchaeota archaeon]
MHTLPNKVQIATGLLVKFKGLYDYTGLYQFMRAWFQKNQYLLQEDRYKDKAFTALGTEIEPKWSAERKINEYIKYQISVEFHIWEGKDVEITENGKKKLMTTGRMTINISSTVLLDYAKIYEGKGKFINFIGEVYKKMRWREMEMVYFNQLEDETFMLQKAIQNYLNMHGKEDAYY